MWFVEAIHNKTDCVCWSEKDKMCVAIKDMPCDNCSFYKTDDEYISQTGRSYDTVEEVMKSYKRYMEGRR